MNRRWLIAVAFVALVIIWGYSWILMKIALTHAGPITFAAQRTVCAGLVLVSLLILLQRPWRPTRIPEVMLLAVLQTSIFVTLSQLSLVDGGVGRSAVLVFTMPIWTVVFAAVLLHERVSPLQAGAVLLAGVGLVAILEPWAMTGSMTSKLIALGAAITWGISNIVAKKIQNRQAIDLLSLTAWQMLFGSVLIVLMSTFVDERATDWNLEFVGILIFAAVIATGLGWFLWLYLLKHLTAGVASMGTLAVPVVAIVSSAYHLNETLNHSEIVGVVTIMFGLLLLAADSFRGVPQTPV